MKSATTLLKKQHKVLFFSFIASLILGMFLLFLGGLAYVNPKLEFSALFKLEPLQNFIYSLIPTIE